MYFHTIVISVSNIELHCEILYRGLFFKDNYIFCDAWRANNKMMLATVLRCRSPPGRIVVKHKQEAAGQSSGSSPTAIAVSWLRATHEKERKTW